jgi:hypothetical protein|tara:strand:+ start:35 stop:442 length:408 start_codon:yes stop_codon:yes gene_type:complete
MDKHKFFKEVSKFKTHKLELSLNDEARQILDNLFEFRARMISLAEKNNEAMEQYTKAQDLFRDMLSEGEDMMGKYNNTKNEAQNLISNIESQVSDLGIDAETIPYYRNLINNLNDTKEDEEALSFWLNNWTNFTV